MPRIIDITNPDLVRALTHPLRRQILISLRGNSLSPSQIAADLGESLATVGYHVRRLADADLITLVDTRRRRGAIEHFYTTSAHGYLPDDIWADLPISAQQAVAHSWLEQAGTEAAEALRADTADIYLVRTITRLDADAQAELALALTHLHELTTRLEKDTLRRERQHSTGTSEPFELILIGFPVRSDATSNQHSVRTSATIPLGVRS